MSMARVVSPEAWRAAVEALRVKEKAATRTRDVLAAERRRLPMVRIERDYRFEGPDGEAHLRDLFAGRRQLILYHFMFAPGVEGWPAAGCVGCSFFVDSVAHLAHLHERDTSFVLVSRAPLAEHRAVQGADGLEHSLVLLVRQRFQRRLRGHDRRARDICTQCLLP